MSNLTLRGNAGGAGTFILESPNSANSRTLTLPDATTTLVGTDATQTLTNKTINGGAITLGVAQNSTSGTNIDFTGIPSWAKRVSLLFGGVSLNAATSFLVQLGDAGGFETSGYTGVLSSIAPLSAGGGAAGAANPTSGFELYLLNAANTLDGVLDLQLLNPSTNLWIANFLGALSENRQVLMTGRKSLSETLDRVRVTSVTGTAVFDPGTINIMYEG